MTDLVIFNILIPLTDDSTGHRHPHTKFSAWERLSVERFGGLTLTGKGVEGYWLDPDLPTASSPVRDLSRAYKIGISPDRVPELRTHLERTAREFGQKCLYLERAGEAEFVWDPARRIDKG